MPPANLPAAPSASDLKRAVQAQIDDHADELVRIARRIARNPEPGFREAGTARLVSETFRRLGMAPQEGIAITGVKARARGGSDGPNVAVLGELDSLIVPTHPLSDPDTGAAHACGHHCQMGNMLGAAFGLCSGDVLMHLAGSVTFMAVPAEEFIELEWREQLRSEGKIAFLGGKPEFIRLGHFDDVDLAMLTHTSPDYSGFGVNRSNNGMVGKVVRFEGVSAHAGGAPHEGVNALNAAHIALAAIHAQRETFRDADSIRVHPIITRGGSVVNAVPDDVRMEMYVRGARVEAILDANRGVDRALRAGALAVGGKVRIKTVPGYLPLRHHEALSELYARNAKALVGEGNVRGGGHGGGSTDMGDLSHLLPTIQPYVGGATGRGHSESYLIADYELAVVKAAKAMAMTVVDLLADGASGAARVASGFKPRMTKPEYVDFMSDLFTDRTYAE